MIDYLVFPLFVFGSTWIAALLQAHGVPNLLVTPLVVGPLAGIAVLLESAHPEWPKPSRREIPITVEALHFICNFELGYSLALGATWLVERALRLAYPPIWPTSWPIVAQLALAVLLYEALSYWQHRWLHVHARIWPFHVLHHSGGYLDFIRAVRFHWVDFVTAAFMAYVGLAIFGAPDDIATLLAVFASGLGISQHANIRQRTPVWLDWLFCTPAVHRRHHARDREESDCNYANTVMCFDHLFGTYGKPQAVAPEAMGLDTDPLPEGFRAQFLQPFRSK